MPAPHYSMFYRPDALPDAQPRMSKYWRQSYWDIKSRFSLQAVCFSWCHTIYASSITNVCVMFAGISRVFMLNVMCSTFRRLTWPGLVHCWVTCVTWPDFIDCVVEVERVQCASVTTAWWASTSTECPNSTRLLTHLVSAACCRWWICMLGIGWCDWLSIDHMNTPKAGEPAYHSCPLLSFSKYFKSVHLIKAV